MDPTVNKLLDIDRQARQSIEKANQYRDETLAKLTQEKKTLSENAEKTLASAREELSAKLGSEVDGYVKTINSDSDAAKERMRGIYENGCAAWADEIFSRCIAGLGGGKDAA
jgi:hypothetical protein